ncbi:glycosyltransferase family 2 protein [Galactobacter valiniphilus]|uniref:glycosyltransferase family 2 protein n=1 Tax=Galactobacter valiniphilus TaxID=2676122 RepID=UPI003735D563
MSGTPLAPGHDGAAPVSAVIATIGGRPELLRLAVESIFDQRTASGGRWPLEVIVVFDHVEPLDLSDVDVPEGSRLLVTVNQGPQGLAGGRNTGIRAATSAVVGFCDDDDAWLPGKLASQLPLLASRPEARAVAGSMLVRTGGKDVERRAPERVDFAQLLRSRVQEIHPSSLMYRRADLLGELGLVDEELPHGYGEDYDMMLRAGRLGGIVSVQQPVVRVLWDRPSYFMGKWRSVAEGLGYLLEKFPEFEQDPKGLSRMAGQIAYARAALGERPEARRWAKLALRNDRGQLRAWAALAVAGRVLPAGLVLSAVQRTGHGL